MNYVVVAVYYDVPGVGEALPKILGFVNAKYREVVGHNVRRKQILKFDLAKNYTGRVKCVCTLPRKRWRNQKMNNRERIMRLRQEKKLDRNEMIQLLETANREDREYLAAQARGSGEDLWEGRICSGAD